MIQSDILATKTWEKEDNETVMVDSFSHCIIIWNDDVNSFEWVIETLMEVCSHTAEQAEQCAFIIHYNGKYAVKEGSFKTLQPMCVAITDRGINATIEENVRKG